MRESERERMRERESEREWEREGVRERVLVSERERGKHHKYDLALPCQVSLLEQTTNSAKSAQ